MMTVCHQQVIITGHAKESARNKKKKKKKNQLYATSRSASESTRIVILFHGLQMAKHSFQQPLRGHNGILFALRP